MKKKYELTDETLEWGTHILHRIKALKEFAEVKKGDLGGWVESEYNLSQDGTCWVYDDAKVFENARISLDAIIYNNAQVFGNARVYGNAVVCSTAKVYDNAKVSDNAWPESMPGWISLIGKKGISWYIFRWSLILFVSMRRVKI